MDSLHADYRFDELTPTVKFLKPNRNCGNFLWHPRNRWYLCDQFRYKTGKNGRDVKIF